MKDPSAVLDWKGPPRVRGEDPPTAGQLTLTGGLPACAGKTTLGTAMGTRS
ncbi:hypothetical protein OG205_04645 [Lentzea sp. NBC_00516]|uniref:hypothetical protein n=1 Tax=Lentzea sp. NBC_00516 TaxID=2903582 RepID=UPI002E81E779|nr:hypothetical protein [Lentzea sp. NBC_00516]WUD26302.1 hypothetical protein OG205_04645 [Lentzea sp. NBC_00516]